MISFSLSQIAFSLVAASLLGIICSAVYALIGLAVNVIRRLSADIKSIVKFDTIFPLPGFGGYDRSEGGALIILLYVLIFGIGFSLTSYIALDGEIRLYMLIFSFASLYLSNIVFFNFLKKLLSYIYSLLLRALCIPIRIICAGIKLLKRRIILSLKINKTKVKNI